MLTMTNDKTRENRLRRKADRMGLRLVKARSRDSDAIDYGCYFLADIGSGGAVFGMGPIGRPEASLDEIEDYLKGE